MLAAVADLNNALLLTSRYDEEASINKSPPIRSRYDEEADLNKTLVLQQQLR